MPAKSLCTTAATANCFSFFRESLPQSLGAMHSFALMNIYHHLHSDREAGATFSDNEWLIWRIAKPSRVSPPYLTLFQSTSWKRRSEAAAIRKKNPARRVEKVLERLTQPTHVQGNRVYQWGRSLIPLQPRKTKGRTGCCCWGACAAEIRHSRQYHFLHFFSIFCQILLVQLIGGCSSLSRGISSSSQDTFMVFSGQQQWVHCRCLEAIPPFFPPLTNRELPTHLRSWMSSLA